MKYPHKILAIGGGTGLPAVLEGLSGFPVFLQAGVTVTDNGGDAGRFREIDGAPSFGDYARAIVPLSKRKTVTRHFEKRINYKGGIHKVRNVIFHERLRHFGDFRSTIEATDSWLRMEGGTGIPTTFDAAHLFARLDDGSVIVGESNIDIPKHDGEKRIVDMWLEPEAKANPAFLHAIMHADMIVISPGDVFTSSIAALLPSGTMEALRNSPARKVFMLNMMTKWGETNDFQLRDFIGALAHFVGADIVNDILVNSTPPSDEILLRYKKEKAEWIVVDENDPYRSRVTYAPFLSSRLIARHDPKLIRRAFGSLYPNIFTVDSEANDLLLDQSIVA
jgi:uncharacterized cofD-like protein